MQANETCCVSALSASAPYGVINTKEYISIVTAVAN